MAIGAILTLGYGSFGSVNLLPTLGLGDYGGAIDDDGDGLGYMRRYKRKYIQQDDDEIMTILAAMMPLITNKWTRH